MAVINQVGNSLTGLTGTGKFVGDDTPTLITPNIGAATGTSIDLGSSTVINGFIDDDSFATASATTGATSESIKAYVDAEAGGAVDSVTGTANEVDVDNADPANPVLSLSSTLDFPGTFTAQNTIDIDAIIDDDTMATATATNLSTSEAIKAYVDAQAGGGGGLQSVQVFTSDGTWTKPSGITKIVVEVVSGGGGGGAASVNSVIGGGGGSGGYGKKLIDVTAIASETVTVGAGGAASSGGDGGDGGTSSFGAHVSVVSTFTGGIANGVASIPSGGASTGGDINVVGQRGNRGGSSSFAVTANGGDGASCIYGAGGRRGIAGGSGDPGGGFGAGGGGGFRDTATTRNGGAGAAGVVIVWEYS
jgi:hypothetical protein